MKVLFVGFATVDIINNTFYHGGAAGAMSINAAKLGFESHLLTVLSNDQFGSYYTEELKKNNVNLELSIFSAPSIPTCKINDLFGLGSKREWHDNGCLPYFDLIKVTAEQLQVFDLIFISNARPLLAENVANAVSKRIICYTPGPKVVTESGIIRDNVLNKSRIVFSNEEESVPVLETLPFNRGVEQVVITTGEKGGTVKTITGETPFTSPQTVTVVDTTGAGDAFALGYGTKYFETDSIKNAIDYGLQLAGKVIAKPGAVL